MTFEQWGFVGLALFALLAMHWLTKRSYCSISALYQAISDEPLIISTEPAPGWKEMPGHRRVTNRSTSILYWQTVQDGKTIETIDGIVHGLSGGIWATFSAEELITLTQNAAHIDPHAVGHREEWELIRVLRSVRAALNTDATEIDPLSLFGCR